ncbi:hypothetical protein [Nocardia sp. NPDC052566]|uniref:F0F1 ATP synthase subunit B family protein n=1 Tax=Nocardia sp. NPDC052566 TaxID=3364330 RepID=UPI0037C9B283
MFHLIWDWPVFLSQLFGFAVVVYVVVSWVMPHVRAAMNKAQNVIRTQMADSERAAVQVEAAGEAHEAALAQAGIAAALEEKEANAAAARILAGMRTEADEVAVRIERQGRERIGQARKELVRTLRAGHHADVLDRTEYLVRHRVASAPAESGGIDRFLDELDAVA